MTEDKVGYVIVCSDNKRARVVNDSTGEAEITPYFEYPAQAFNYISKHLGNSPSVRVHTVGGNKMITEHEWLVRKLEGVERRLKASPSEYPQKQKRLDLLSKIIEFTIDLGNFKE